MLCMLHLSRYGNETPPPPPRYVLWKIQSIAARVAAERESSAHTAGGNGERNLKKGLAGSGILVKKVRV